MKFTQFLLLLPMVFGIPTNGRVPAQAPAPSARSQDSTEASAYEQAFKLLQAGQAAEALHQIDAALVRTPHDVQLLNLRGLASSQLGHPKEAEQSFRKVIELAPHSSLGYNNLATLLSDQGQYQAAEGLFRAALKQEPGNFTALLGLGVTLESLREFANAAPFLEKAWRLRPADFQAGYEYARSLRELKRLPEAHRVLSAMTPPQEPGLSAKYYSLSAIVTEERGDRTAALRNYRKAYELAPDSFDIYMALLKASFPANDGKVAEALPLPPAHLTSEQLFTVGVLLASHEDYARAIPNFQKALELDPDNYAATYNLLLALRGAGNSQGALDLGESALTKWPASAELHNMIGSLDESAGNYLDSVRHLRQAVELAPQKEGYYFDLGIEYLTHFTFTPALEVFKIGGKKFPTIARERIGLGLAHYALRQYDEAADAFLSALEIDPTSRMALGAWNSLPAFLAASQMEKFLPRLERLAGQNPRAPGVLFCYGASLAHYAIAAAMPDNLEKAQSLLERTVQLQPKFAEAYLELGSLEMARRQDAKAAAMFKEALSLDPHSEMAHYRLGQAYRNLNQLEQAQQELAIYSDLTRTRRALMSRRLSAVKQFILAQSESQKHSR